ncbi:MAG TPA: penicillin-binding transpeptidase domain-containing protein, partial [Phototrophicaceae bacterium]|nr:penicillin-binding transpeptidase domain-containing protein [Phototrophicaceae bacterium]
TALLTDYPLDQPETDATQPLKLDGLTLSCSLQPPGSDLTLAEAYAYGCPFSFATLFNQVDPLRIQESFSLFRLDTPYILPGFTPETIGGNLTPTPEVTPTVIPISTELTLDNALGQGNLTLSPLDVAVMTAAIVNEGNAPQPVMLLATRLPGDSNWTPVNAIYPSTPVTTAEISRRLQELMRDATRNGSAIKAARDGMNIGGHAALAYSGTTTNVWFTGFIITGPRQGIVVALVLEGHNDTTEAAAIGGQILEAAFNQSIPASQ